jgi:protein-disulfide isomerase
MSETGENSLFIKAILLIGAAIGLVAITWGVITLSSPTSDTTSDSLDGEVAEELPEVTEDDHVFGDREAQITIVEYSDFQCPACAQYEPVLKRLTEDYPDDVRVVYRHFPLRSIHANAEPAARASEAAALQGEFQAYHDELFDTQDEWSSLRGGERDDFFVEIARGLELNVEEFKTDYESEEVKEAVRSDLQAAQDLGLNSTPSIFLNGVRIQNPSGYQAFAELIEAEIERVESESGTEESEQEASEEESGTTEDAEETESNQ